MAEVIVGSPDGHKKLTMPDDKAKELAKKMAELVNNAGGRVDHEQKPRKLLATYKMRPKWKPLLVEMKKCSDDLRKKMAEAKELFDKGLTAKARFWSTVETDLGHFSTSMTYVPEKDIIEEYDRPEDDDE